MGRGYRTLAIACQGNLVAFIMGDVGAETTCHQCHSRVATRRPSVLVPGRGPVSRLSRGHGGRVPGCDHRGGESCYPDRSHAQVGRVSLSCLRTNVPHHAGNLSPCSVSPSGHSKAGGVTLRAPIGRGAMRVMAHPAFHIAFVGCVGVPRHCSGALSHLGQVPVTPDTPCRRGLRLRSDLFVAGAAREPGFRVAIREEGQILRPGADGP
jgi:hypothetical protein